MIAILRRQADTGNQITALRAPGRPCVIRDYVSYNEAFASDLPDWATEEHYDDCTTGASWLYRFLKK